MGHCRPGDIRRGVETVQKTAETRDTSAERDESEEIDGESGGGEYFARKGEKKRGETAGEVATTGASWSGRAEGGGERERFKQRERRGLNARRTTHRHTQREYVCDR